MMIPNLLKTLICLAVMIMLLGMAMAEPDAGTAKVLSCSAIVVGAIATYYSKQKSNEPSENY